MLDVFTDFIFVFRNGKAPQVPPPDTGTPSMSTFFSDSPDSPMDLGMSGTIRDCGRDLGRFSNRPEEHGPAASTQAPSASAPDDEIAPWLSTGPATFNGVAHNGSFFDDRPTNTQSPTTARPDTRASDSFDPMFYNDDRRPSMASATTVSSQNSAPISRTSTNRGTQHRRLGAFFGDDGHDSSRSSGTSILTTGRDHSTSSQSRKARHNSVQTNNTDGGRTASPSSSRPRSPLPSSDVTPWLFQDFKVSARDTVCPCTTKSCMFAQRCILSASRRPAYPLVGKDLPLLLRHFVALAHSDTAKMVHLPFTWQVNTVQRMSSNRERNLGRQDLFALRKPSDCYNEGLCSFLHFAAQSSSIMRTPSRLP